MFHKLNQKYPAPKPELRSIITAILFGLFVGLFLLFFEPFDINLSTHKNKTIELLFFGAITTIILLVFLYLFPLLFPEVFSDMRWKVKHQIVFYLIVLFVIATFNGLYTIYINDFDFSWANYWWIIYRTYILGGIPLAFIVLIDQQRKAKMNAGQAQTMLNSIKDFEKDTTETSYRIATDLKNETISFAEDDFYYAVATGNYIDIYISTKVSLKKETYRLALSSLEAQLDTTSLVRCHRSYLVNLKKVKNVSGNAQGLKLTFNNQLDIVPVTRKYIPIVKQFFLKN